MAKLISQREAQRLRKHVQKLELAEMKRRSQWATEYPGGTPIAVVDLLTLPKSLSAIETARKLDHAVVVTMQGNNAVFYALLVART